MGISEAYITSFRRNFKFYYPNWIPDRFLELGDFGYLDHDVFIRKGNITTDFCINFSTKTTPLNFNNQFGSEAELDINTDASGKYNKSVNGSIKIKFKSANSAFFNSTFYESAEIANLTFIENKLKKNLDWKRSNVIVGALYRSKNTIIAISTQKNAEVEIASRISDIIDLQSIEAHLEVRKKTNDTNVFCSSGNNFIVPMFKLLKLKNIINVSLKVLRGGSAADEDMMVHDLYENENTDYKLEFIE